MENGQVRPSYCNLVVLMDPTFVATFGNGNAQVAKAKALPDIEGAVNGLNTIFSYYGLSFKVVFFPTNYLIPSYLNYNAISPWSDAIRTNFKNNYPCIQSDVIIALTSSFSTGGGHGTNGVAAVSGNLSPWLVAHEIGHNIGLSHEGGGCEANCSPLKFMCELNGNIISFNECDYENIADVDGGVFSRGVACLPCRCNIWADFVDVFPDNYICPVTPKVSITSDQPYLTLPSEGCVPDRSNSMITVTVNGGENGVVNGRLRIRYQPSIYNWTQADGGDFDVTEDLPTNDPDYPFFKELKNYISGSTDEYIFQLDPYQDVTFYTKIKYMPTNGTNPSTELPLRIKARLISSSNPITSILGPKYLQTASGSISFFNVNQPYLVTGDLTLELTQGVSIFTLPPLLLVKNGAKITLPSANINGVSSSVNLVNNGKPGIVAGCNTMWKGFEVNESSKLEISNATVKDAQFAVNLKRGATLVANSTKFINNNFGVYTNSAGNGSHAISILGASFETAGNLLPSYSGQTPALLENDKGFVGIYLSNVYNPITISIDPNTGQSPIFKNLKYGIISKNAQLSINTATFDDIQEVTKGSGYAGFASVSTGKAIYAERGTLVVSKGYELPLLFRNCHTGVESTGTSNRIQTTTMENVTNGIISTNCNYALYTFNKISASQNGISMRHSTPLGIPPVADNPTVINGVNFNEIVIDKPYDNNPKFVATGVGIGTYGTIVSTTYAPAQFLGGKVLGNKIDVKNGARAIDINDASQIRVDENDITMLSGTYNKQGIYLGASETNQLNCNNITATQGDIAGIYEIHPSRSSIKCNLINQSNKGIQIEGLLIGKGKADIAGNTMLNNSTGLYYGKDAVTGNQVHRGNRWEGSSSMAINNGGVLGALQSEYFVNPQANPEYIPTISQPQIWFVQEEGELPYSCPNDGAGDCYFPYNPINSDITLDRKIATNQLTGITYQNHNNWLAQRRLYERIMKDGNPYPGNTDINNFLTIAQNNGIASYAGIRANISDLYTISANDRTSFQNYDRQIINGMHLKDSLTQLLFKRGINLQDSIALAGRINGIQQAVIQAAYNQDSLLVQINQVRTNAAQAMVIQNSSLAGTAIYEQNEKAVNDIFLRTVAQGVMAFSYQDSINLVQIADGCPLSNGEAVLRARSLLILVQQTPTLYDDQTICNNTDRNEVLTNHSKNQSLVIFPNPANDHLTIQYRGENWGGRNFELFNGLGQRIRSIRFSTDGEGFINVETGDLNPGIYWYQVSGNASDPFVGKIIIQH